MKMDFTFRWWDVLALTLAMGAAVMVVQYSISREKASPQIKGVALVEVRIPKPLPEIVAQLDPGDELFNSKGERIGEIITVQPVPAMDQPELDVPLAGRQDVKLALRVHGALRLVRSVPGFPPEACELKAGAWCLISTRRVEISAMVTKFEVYKEEQGVACVAP